jgi:hypothetical protein
MTRPGARDGIDSQIGCKGPQPIPTWAAWANPAEATESKGEQPLSPKPRGDRDRLHQLAASRDYADQSIQSSNSS